MTREPLHYWRRRRGLKLGQHIMNMRLKRIYWHDHQERLYNGSAMLSALTGRRHGMSMNAAQFVGDPGKAYP